MFEAHTHVKKKIVPNIVLTDKLYDVNYPNNILPEIILVGLLIRNKSKKEAYSLIYNIFNLTHLSLIDFSKKTPLLSFYIKLKSSEFIKIKNELIKNSLWKEFNTALCLLIKFLNIETDYKDHLEFAELPKQNEIETIKTLINNLYNRRNDFASDVQVLIYMGYVIFERIKFTREELIPNFDLFINGNSTEIREKLYGRCRAGINGMFMPEICAEESKVWCKEFWSKIFLIEPLELNLERTKITSNELTEFEKMLLDVEEEILKNIEYLAGSIPIDPLNIRTYEVQIGLLSRMMNLANQFLKNPTLWNYHIGSIILRSMIDLYITAKWIAADLEDRVDKYISYGLGMEKLHIEHLKESIKNEANQETKKQLEDLIKRRIDLLNSEHFFFLQEVNLSNWSGKGTREMAIEIGEKTIYDHAYQPFSSSVHSIWNHILRYDLSSSKNSFNRFIRLPIKIDTEPDLSLLELSMKYLQKHIDFLLQKYNIQNPNKSILDILYNYFE